MFPFWMIDPSGQGRRRRCETSSSESRKRARRRDRRRRRSSSESDRRGRKRERSRDAPQASASSSSLPLGGAPQGYAWVQVPVNAQGLPTMPSMPIAAEATQPPAKEETWDKSWKKQTPWRGGESWKKGTTKSWNKWVNPDWKHNDKPYQQKGYGHKGQGWSQGSSQQQPPPRLPRRHNRGKSPLLSRMLMLGAMSRRLPKQRSLHLLPGRGSKRRSRGMSPCGAMPCRQPLTTKTDPGQRGSWSGRERCGIGGA